MNKVIKILLFSSFIMTIVPVQAGIYKCINNTGKTYYNDMPCPLDNNETELQAVKDPVNGYIPPVFVPEEDVNQKLGVVVGSDTSEAVEEPRIDEDDKVSLGQQGRSEASDQSGETDNGSSDENTALQRTESDNAFNKALNKMTKSLKKDATKNRLNVTTLESIND